MSNLNDVISSLISNNNDIIDSFICSIIDNVKSNINNNINNQDNNVLLLNKSIDCIIYIFIVSNNDNLKTLLYKLNHLKENFSNSNFLISNIISSKNIQASIDNLIDNKIFIKINNIYHSKNLFDIIINLPIKYNIILNEFNIEDKIDSLTYYDNLIYLLIKNNLIDETNKINIGFSFEKFINNSKERFLLLIKNVFNSSKQELYNNNNNNNNNNLIQYLINYYKTKFFDLLININYYNNYNNKIKILYSLLDYNNYVSILCNLNDNNNNNINDINDPKNTIIFYINNLSLINSEIIFKKLITNQEDIMLNILIIIDNINKNTLGSNSSCINYIIAYSKFLLKNINHFVKLIVFNNKLNLLYFTYLIVYCIIYYLTCDVCNLATTLMELNNYLVLLLSLFNNSIIISNISYKYLLIKLINYNIKSIEDIKLKYSNNNSNNNNNIQFIDITMLEDNSITSKEKLIHLFKDKLDFLILFNKLKEDVINTTINYNKINEIYNDICKYINIDLNETKLINNKSNLIKNQNKSTKYISIKFQKKYNTYNNKHNNINKINNKELLEENNNIHKFNKKDLNSKRLIEIKLNSNIKNNEDYYLDTEKVIKCTYLKDIILSLNSEDKKRKTLGILSIEQVIKSKPYDIELYLEDLCLVIIKMLNEENEYDLNNNNTINNELKDYKNNELLSINSINYKNYSNNQNILLSNLLYLLKEYYSKVIQVFCNRFFKHKKEINNDLIYINIENKDKTNKENKLSLRNVESDYSGVKEKYYILILFNVMIKKTDKLDSKIIDKLIMPILHYLSYNKIEFIIKSDIIAYNLLSEFILFVSGALLKFKNSILIYKLLFESHILFKSIIQLDDVKKLKHNTNLNLIISLIYYCNVFTEYLDNKYVEVYPELFDLSKVNIKFLNNCYNDYKDNYQFFNNINLIKCDIKFECMSCLNNYSIKINKIKEEKKMTLNSIFKIIN